MKRRIYYQIDGKNVPGLDRYSLRGYQPGVESGFRAYLHHFLNKDDDGYHNHPWRIAFSLVLRGGYIESRIDTNTGIITYHKVRWLNILTNKHYHRIESINPNTWTLFLVGPLSGKSWGFWIEGRGHVPFKQRYAERSLKL